MIDPVAAARKNLFIPPLHFAPQMYVWDGPKTLFKNRKTFFIFGSPAGCLGVWCQIGQMRVKLLLFFRSLWAIRSSISAVSTGVKATSRSWRWIREVQCLHHVYSQSWSGGILFLNHLASSVTMLPPTIQNVGKPCAVYAGNLSWSTTEEQLLSFGGGDRGAISAEIKRHKDTKRSKGWGYGLNHP